MLKMCHSLCHHCTINGELFQGVFPCKAVEEIGHPSSPEIIHLANASVSRMWYFRNRPSMADRSRMEDTESTWIQQARAGDPAADASASADAFSCLVEAYQTPVYNLAYRMLGNAVEAQDAAQETFVRAYTRLDTYDPGRKFSSWLLAIASHYCVDVLRKRRMVYLSLDDLPPMVELAMPRTTQPEQVVVSQQDAGAVQELLNALPPDYRTPVILRYWYDMSYREIAETMGVSEGIVKTRLHRARARLADHASSTAPDAIPRQAWGEDKYAVEVADESRRPGKWPRVDHPGREPVRL